MLHLLSAVICGPAEAPGGSEWLDGEREIISDIRFYSLCACARAVGCAWKTVWFQKVNVVMMARSAREHQNKLYESVRSNKNAHLPLYILQSIYTHDMSVVVIRFNTHGRWILQQKRNTIKYQCHK